MSYKTYKVSVTQDFVTYANNEFAKRSYSSRYNVDSLILEWNLIKTNKVQPPKSWRHDFIINNKKIDVKEIKTHYFNINSEKKLSQLSYSIKIGELNSFLYYKTNRPSNRILQPGDEVVIDIISSLLNANDELKKVTRGPYGPYIDLRNRLDIVY